MTGSVWSPSPRGPWAWLSRSWIPPSAALMMRLLGCAGDALDQVVHGLDLLHRQLLAGRDHDGAVLLGDRPCPDRCLAGVDVVLQLDDLRLCRRRHGWAEGIKHDVSRSTDRRACWTPSR